MRTVSIYFRSNRNTDDAVLDDCSGLTMTNKTSCKLIIIIVSARSSYIMNRANYSQVFYRCMICASK